MTEEEQDLEEEGLMKDPELFTRTSLIKSQHSPSDSSIPRLSFGLITPSLLWTDANLLEGNLEEQRL